MVEAERLLFSSVWSLFILDISMDVTSGSKSNGTITQATLGGLSFANLIVIEGLEAPTVLVTAFDSFSDKPPGKKISTINDLVFVSATASEYLGDFYKGTVRYGKSNWEEDLKRMLTEIV
jgi:hypothetical protein